MQRRFARKIYEDKLEALQGDGTGGQNFFTGNQTGLARSCCGHFCDTLQNMLDSLMPLRHVVKSVEKQFGTANASFFEFVRWLFYLNLFILLIFVFFIFVPHWTTKSSTAMPASMKVKHTFTTMPTAVKMTPSATNMTTETFTTMPAVINATTESSTIMPTATNVTAKRSRSIPAATNMPTETNATSKTTLAQKRTTSSISRLEAVATCSLEYLQKVHNNSQYEKIALSNNISTEELNKIFEAASEMGIDFLQGTGIFEMTFLFYGNYSPVEGNFSALGDLGIVFKDYNMPLAYILVTFTWMIVCLLAMIHNSASGIKQKMLAHAENATYACCVHVFASWDFCIMKKEMQRAKHGEVRQLLRVEIEERKRIIREREMTRWQRCRRTAIRIVTHLVVLALLVGSFIGIYFAVVYSLKNRHPEQARKSNPLEEDKLQYWVLLVNYLPTIAMAAVNMIIPMLMDKIAMLEEWDPMKELSTKLYRLVFIKLLSLVALILSLYKEITCKWEGQTNDCGICLDEADQEANDLLCWETKVGQQFWRITVLNLLTLLFTCFCIEFPRRLLANYCCRGKDDATNNKDDPDHVVEEAGDGEDADDVDAGTGHTDGSGKVKTRSTNDILPLRAVASCDQQQRKKSRVAEVKRGSRFREMVGDVQFLLERNVLDLVYVQTVFWLSFFFVPLMSAISIFVLFCYFFIYLFKLKVNSRLSDESAFKAAGVNSLFMYALLFSFLFVIIIILFFIINVPPSRACGPFRNHDSMTVPLTMGIESLKWPFNAIIRVIFSHGFLIPIIIFIFIFVYYYKSVVQAHHVLVRILNNQLDDEKAKARGNASETKAKRTSIRVSYLNDRE